MAIERIVPGTIEWEEFYANHICRYEFAKQSIHSSEELNILDAACGVGYGTNFLSSNSNWKLTGIDRSTTALGIANKYFTAKNIQFVGDDCHTLAVAASFGLYDIIVSFETLEHLPNPEAFLASCFKNLKKGGKLIISTPNKLVSSPTGETDWEFHEKEYTPEELLSLLDIAGFAAIKMYGQQMTAIGKLRDQFRAELNRINSNPFQRIGRTIQSFFKGHKFSAVLPEQPEDFEVVPYPDFNQIHQLGTKGPFVLIAVCEKI